MPQLRLPMLFAYQACQSLREWYTGFIIVLSMLEQGQYKLGVFTLGADDYLTKPFSVPELLARIEAHFRRMAPNDTPTKGKRLPEGFLSIDLSQHQVLLNGREIKLTPIEYNILCATRKSSQLPGDE